MGLVDNYHPDVLQTLCYGLTAPAFINNNLGSITLYTGFPVDWTSEKTRPTHKQTDEWNTYRNVFLDIDGCLRPSNWAGLARQEQLGHCAWIHILLKHQLWRTLTLLQPKNRENPLMRCGSSSRIITRSRTSTTHSTVQIRWSNPIPVLRATLGRRQIRVLPPPTLSAPEQNFQLLLLRTMYLRPLQTKSSSSSRLMVVVVTEDYSLWEGDELYKLKNANSLQMTNWRVIGPPPAIGST